LFCTFLEEEYPDYYPDIHCYKDIMKFKSLIDDPILIRKWALCIITTYLGYGSSNVRRPAELKLLTEHLLAERETTKAFFDPLLDVIVPYLKTLFGQLQGWLDMSTQTQTGTDDKGGKGIFGIKSPRKGKTKMGGNPETDAM